MVDLRLARERAGLSQIDLAARLDISQSMVSRYETNVANAPFDVVVRWLSACGSDVATAIGEIANTANSERGLDAGRPYDVLDRGLQVIERYIETTHTRSLTDVTASTPNPGQLETLLRRWKRKPTVLLLGNIESRNSRLANFLLGTDLLPSRYTKTTKLPMFIRHLDEKPKWQAERVWILDSAFDPRLWDDEDHCTKRRLTSGGFERLRNYEIHIKESNRLCLERAAGAALVYVDSKLLHACDLIDLPGIGEAGSEGACRDIYLGFADVLIYTSPARGFLDPNDFDVLPELVRRLPSIESDPSSLFPTLANLFVVATHAHKGFSDRELGEIRTRSAQRLFSYLKEFLWDEPSDANESFSEDLLESRIFTFWEKLPKRNERLAADLFGLLSTTLPRRLMANVSSQLAQFKNAGMAFYARQAEAYTRTLHDFDRLKRDIGEVVAKEETRNDNIKCMHDAVVRDVKKKRDASTSFVNTTLTDSLTSLHEVTKFIEHRFGKSADQKKEAEQYALGLIVRNAERSLQQVIARMSEEVAKQVNVYLETFDPDSTTPSRSPNVTLPVPFDPKAAFAARLAGVTAPGALAFWAANRDTMAGYITMAKFTGALSTLGATHDVKKTVLATIRTESGLAIARLFAVTGTSTEARESWQTRLGQKLIAALGSGSVINSYRIQVEAYWADTLEAFRSVAESTESNLRLQQNRLEDLLQEKEQPAKRLHGIIDGLDQQRIFFAGLPGRP